MNKAKNPTLRLFILNQKPALTTDLNYRLLRKYDTNIYYLCIPYPCNSATVNRYITFHNTKM
jgi:hypothetical protein